MTHHDPHIPPVDQLLQERITAKLQATAPSCPENVWEELRERLQSSSQSTSSAPRSHRLFKLIPYAAGLLLVLGLLLWQKGTPPAQAIEIAVDFPATTQEFRQQVSTRGTPEQIQQQLAEKGYAVQIGDIAAYNSSHGHHVRLLGIDPVEVDGKPCPSCLRVSFLCCGQPVVSYVVKSEESSGKITFKPTNAQIHHNEHSCQGCRIVTLSTHPTDAVQTVMGAE